jgi:hypothetical protein
VDSVSGRIGEVHPLGFSREIGLREGAENEGRDDVGALEQVGVVADFSELHDEVHEVFGGIGIGAVD